MFFHCVLFVNLLFIFLCFLSLYIQLFVDLASSMCSVEILPFCAERNEEARSNDVQVYNGKI